MRQHTWRRTFGSRPWRIRTRALHGLARPLTCLRFTRGIGRARSRRPFARSRQTAPWKPCSFRPVWWRSPRSATRPSCSRSCWPRAIASRLPIAFGILIATLVNHGLAAWLGALAAGWLGPDAMRWILGARLPRHGRLVPDPRQGGRTGRRRSPGRRLPRHPGRVLPGRDRRQDPDRHRRAGRALPRASCWSPPAPPSA